MKVSLSTVDLDLKDLKKDKSRNALNDIDDVTPEGL
jgi:hypothetical protein